MLCYLRDGHRRFKPLNVECRDAAPISNLKNQWLYPNTVDSVNAVRNLVEFCVTEHNTQLPHSAFSGQTPDEFHFGTKEDISEQLKEKRATARSARLAWNKQATCESCAQRATAFAT